MTDKDWDDFEDIIIETNKAKAELRKRKTGD